MECTGAYRSSDHGARGSGRSEDGAFLGEVRLVVLRDFHEMPSSEQQALVQELKPDQENVLVIVTDSLDKRTEGGTDYPASGRSR